VDPVVSERSVPDAVGQQLGHQQAQLAELLLADRVLQAIKRMPTLTGSFGAGPQLHVQLPDHLVPA
jgi:hypothetical protein